MARSKTAIDETPVSRHVPAVHAYVAEALELLAQIETGLEDAYNDVEGHLRVAVVHLRHIVAHIEHDVDPDPVVVEPEPVPADGDPGDEADPDDTTPDDDTAPATV